MPRLSRQTAAVRTILSGPTTSPLREKELRLVKKISISPEIESLLETPTWSVASLLPPAPSRNGNSDVSSLSSRQSSSSTYEAEAESEITREKLLHLLKLSALPPPKSKWEEQDMLDNLRDQVHFVKEIQKVNTEGVQPLVAIRDETSEHRLEKTITRESLAEFIALEEKKGKNGTIRRKKDTYQVTSYTTDSESWREDRIGWTEVKDPWANGEGAESRKMGKFFFVKRKQSGQDERGKNEKKVADTDVDCRRQKEEHLWLV